MDRLEKTLSILDELEDMHKPRELSIVELDLESLNEPTILKTPKEALTENGIRIKNTVASLHKTLNTKQELDDTLKNNITENLKYLANLCNENPELLKELHTFDIQTVAESMRKTYKIHKAKIDAKEEKKLQALAEVAEVELDFGDLGDFGDI